MLFTSTLADIIIIININIITITTTATPILRL